MKKLILLSTLCLGIAAFPVSSFAQDEVEAAPAAAGELVATEGAAAPKKNNTFYQVLFGSGFLGTFLWLCLFGCIGAYIWLLIDNTLTISTKKIIPQTLIDSVENAMKEGDVVKALECCRSEPGPMANILISGFSHVEEGYDVIQEAISTAADLEVEKIQQRLGWFNVVANVSPSFGLLGTVQGMIMAFGHIGGTIEIAVLSTDIGQALWTTAFGLCASIPCVLTFNVFRNSANRIVLRMEALTMELVKGLRNVEVVEE